MVTVSGRSGHDAGVRTGPDANGTATPSDGLHLRDVVLIDPNNVESGVSGMTLEIDHRGVVVTASGTGRPKVIGWSRVSGWRVDPWVHEVGTVGAVITYASDFGTHRFGINAGDATALGYLVDQLSRGYIDAKSTAATTQAETEATRQPASGIQARVDRARPVLVLVLVLVIAAAVTLILLQSAGVIHLPLLGGNGSSPAGLGHGAAAGAPTN
jgi:hypothetical protein